MRSPSLLTATIRSGDRRSLMWSIVCATAVVLFALATPSVAFAESEEAASADATGATETDAKWTIQVDPLTTFLGFAHVQVERAFGDHFSLYLGPSLRLWTSPILEEEFTGLGGEVGVRVYPFGGAPRGPWLLARSVFAHLSTDSAGGQVTSFGGYSSVLAGYTHTWDWFVLSGGAGGQYFYYTVDGKGPSGPNIALHTAVGVIF